MKHPELRFLGQEELNAEQAELARSIESICLAPPAEGVQQFFDLIGNPEGGGDIMVRRYAEYHLHNMQNLRVEQPGVIYRAMGEYLAPLCAHYERSELADDMIEMLPTAAWRATAYRALVGRGHGEYLPGYIREAEAADVVAHTRGAFKQTLPLDYLDRPALVRDIYELALFVDNQEVADEVASSISEEERRALQANSDRRKRTPEARHAERMGLMEQGHWI